MTVRDIWLPLSDLGAMTPLVFMFVLGLALLTMSRLALMVWQRQRVLASGLWPQILLQGLRVDVIQLSILCVIPALFLPLSEVNGLWDEWELFTYYWVIAGMTLLLFLEAATPGFIAEYDVRPNRLFVEYLKYPREVFSMLWKGFRIHIIFGLLVTVLSIWLLSRLMQPWLEQRDTWSLTQTLLIWPVLIVVLVLAIRSTLGHRPANPAMFAITADTMVNSLVLNSLWSVLHAIYSLRHESKTSAMYGRMSMQAVLQELSRERAESPGMAPFLGMPERPSLSILEPSRKRERPLNLVIVLEESMGATFVESLGGIPVTPELEKLKEQGWWFERLFATGTRSVRGIEAVVSGFPPTPAQAAVKLSLSQSGFFSLADLLGRRGYHTEFIYGGESHFDNMNGFFRGNGFQNIIDQPQYVAPIFTGSWGVSDEDLFNRAHDSISALHAAGTSFFKLVFSSSNHSPFEFPDGRIELHDEKKATEANAVKYADHALGQFFARARQSDYWQDTLFIIVADHDIKVRGESLVPVRNFHIPALILGADIEPRRINTVCSQMDLPVTALSLMGISAMHPMPGRDISRSNASDSGRAIMQFEDNYAFMQGNEAVILRPGNTPVHACYDFESKKVRIVDAPANAAEKEARALANALMPHLLYEAQQYRLPD
ncbi:MAG: LTA synthase family protein [Gammaproteobacteria bacterium]|nr:LTA synthase family protein [Gammaproteobacteria bacterium]MDP2139835.1 LTA synthase family protein [Gammaproteobacteria bacterium]MDP2347076.1 LTA synthase family protein [Gammaproteobacteria bacterium]